MHGARWGWVALIAAITVLFVASSQDQSGSNKMATLLRQELKATNAERDHAIAERDEAHETIAGLQEFSHVLDQELTQTGEQLRALKAERDKLRKELTSLSQDRNQLQQTVASLQVERSQIKRNVEQLRHGLQQLLSQSDAVASQLAGPAPGFAQTTFDETPVPVPVALKSQPMKNCSSEGTYYTDEPLNDNQ